MKYIVEFTSKTEDRNKATFWSKSEAVEFAKAIKSLMKSVVIYELNTYNSKVEF